MAGLPYIPSDSRTACAVCGFPIADLLYHSRAIASGENTAAVIHNTPGGETVLAAVNTSASGAGPGGGTGTKPLKNICRRS